jgi:hypothetical protein
MVAARSPSAQLQGREIDEVHRSERIANSVPLTPDASPLRGIESMEVPEDDVVDLSRLEAFG